jgi:hypothetical protein
MDALKVAQGPQYNGQARQAKDPETDPMSSPSSWNQPSSHSIGFSMPFHSSPEERALSATPLLDQIWVMDEFRQYTSQFEFTNQRDSSLPIEMVSGFSQDWPFDMSFDEGLFDSSMRESLPQDGMVGLGKQ